MQEDLSGQDVGGPGAIGWAGGKTKVAGGRGDGKDYIWFESRGV
jgi:hypothetical protein